MLSNHDLINMVDIANEIVHLEEEAERQAKTLKLYAKRLKEEAYPEYVMVDGKLYKISLRDVKGGNTSLTVKEQYYKELRSVL